MLNGNAPRYFTRPVRSPSIPRSATKLTVFVSLNEAATCCLPVEGSVAPTSMLTRSASVVLGSSVALVFFGNARR